MKRLALIADIHGNHLALRAVLDDIGKHSADAVYCLGDLVGYAPFPNEVIEIIRQEGIPTAMGNYDDRLEDGLEVEFLKAPYDTVMIAEAILAAGLPAAFAEQVLTGKDE
jgi:predicted phosphodiesterase